MTTHTNPQVWLTVALAALLAGCGPVQKLINQWQAVHPPFTIGEVSSTPELTYYGSTCGADEPDSLTITAVVTGRPRTVEVRYAYSLPRGARGPEMTMPMQPVGRDQYEAVITHDFAAVSAVLGGRNGVIMYDVFAEAPNYQAGVGGGTRGVWACTTP